MLPWIVMEFIRLFAKVIFLIMVLIVWAIYVGENADYSHIIATGVIGAGATGEHTQFVFLHFHINLRFFFLFSFLLLLMALRCQLFSTLTRN